MNKILLPSLLMALVLTSCGGSGVDPSSSSSSAPLDEQGYFNRLSDAMDKTSKVDGYRMYTPHANAKLGIFENGYVNANVGFLINPGENETNFSLELKKMPIDIIFAGRNEEDKNKRAFSMTNSLEDVDGKMSGKLGSYPFSNLPVPNFSTYFQDGKLYIDAYALARQIRTITLGSVKIPYDGRVCFPPLSEEEIRNDPEISSMLDDMPVDIPSDYEEFSLNDILDMMSFLDDLGGVDFTKVFDRLSEFDYSLYEVTGPAYWTFEGEDTIKLKIEGQDKLRAFLLSAYDEIFDDIPVVGAEVPDKEETIDSFLETMNFESFESVYKFSDKGVAYNTYALAISSLNSDKFVYKDEEGVEQPLDIVPNGRFALSYGFAYDYETTTPKRVTNPKDFTEIDYVDLLKDLLEAIPSGEEEETSSN